MTQNPKTSFTLSRAAIFNLAARYAEAGNDGRRPELNVLGVMSHDAVKVAAVPRRHPHTPLHMPGPAQWHGHHCPDPGTTPRQAERSGGRPADLSRPRSDPGDCPPAFSSAKVAHACSS